MIESTVLENVCSKIFDGNLPLLQTGFRDLDTILSGVEKGSLITIGSRPAMGKTSFINTIMLNLLKQNKKCLYFSFEMSEEQLVKRLIGQVAEVDSVLLNNPAAISRSPKDANKVAEAVNKLAEYDITISDNKVTVESMKEKTEQVKPEYVFIDYLQLIEVPRKKARAEAFEEVMINLKQIAKDNNCIIFITSQLSRATESRIDKRPLLSDLRESGAVENISDVVMFVYRDDYYTFCDDEDYARNKNKAEIIVAKNRYGTVATVELIFRPTIMKFLEEIRNDNKF